MTLSSIAKKNIKKNIRRYFIYLNSMIFSISIYFTFVSLQFNKQLLGTSVTLGKIQPAFQAASIILMIFAAIFIWYSNSFFTRKRKKEIGLYLLFGMSRKKIGLLLFLENLLIGGVALVIGVLAGIMFSKLFMMIIFKLMGFSLVVSFSFRPQALLQTLLVFLFIIILASVYNYFLIYRFSLSELFKAERKGERGGGGSAVLSLLAVFLLGISYLFFVNPQEIVPITNSGIRLLLSAIFLIIGSFLFMNSLITYILIVLQKITSIYFKGENLLSLTHLLFRIKSNVIILTVISLLSSVTILACVSTYSFYYHINTFSKKDNPYSYMFNMKDEELNEQMQELVEKSASKTLEYQNIAEYLPIKADTSALGRMNDSFQVLLISKNTYQSLMKNRGINEQIHLSKHDAFTFYDGNLDVKSDPYTGKTLSLPNHEQITISSYKHHSLLNQGEKLFPVVISDTLFNELKEKTAPQKLYLYKLTNEKTAKKLNHDLGQFVNPNRYAESLPIYSSFYENYHYGLETYGLLIFIGSFLGLVFLLATGSLIYFKQLIEATSDKDRYRILRKIGAPEKEVKKSVAKQVGFVFFLPLLLAITNSAVVTYVLADFLQINMFLPFITCLLVYLIIYLVYYGFTTSNYLRIIK
ncbi:ABC transporter permease [Paenibacillus sp. BSR1-1]|uniref:FtsX-like permease family protein n=1 Tax=Paenibacillus sp. BSR1-1 TaxID=3020845 RepID=UPI0025B03DCD|nr:ABC transporter permease [Paenibacillus sp. BSR1-1]MDN3015965.1 ABC transporter permease [Paenibacillus sp. BSR1-1]